MPLNREAARRQPGQIAGAVVHVEHPLAGGALKVMMVAVADGLVASRLARRRDRLLRRLASQQAAAVRAEQVMAAHEAVLTRQRQSAEALRFLSPAAALSRALDDVSGNSGARYREFQYQVEVFHREWQGFFRQRIAADRSLTLADYEAFPRFVFEETPAMWRMPRLAVDALWLLVTLFALGAVAAVRMRRVTPLTAWPGYPESTPAAA